MPKAFLSERVATLKPSPTLAITAKAAQLKKEGRNIISLGAGEPYFDTPNPIQEAAMKAIQSGQTRYTPADGTQALKQAIQQKFKRENQLDYELTEIIASTGAKQALFNAIQVLINPTDEVIIPAPYWVSYPSMVLIASGIPKVIETTLENHFKLTPEQLDQHITPKTKLVILNSPSNPSGMVYTKSELQAFGEILAKHPHVFVLLDDIYEHILWNHRPFYNLLMVCPELRERTLVVNGVSKAYAMTGWRIGYAAGPAEIIKAMKNIQAQSTSNPCSVSQAAAVQALNMDQSIVNDMLKIFKHHHDVTFDFLKKIPGFECNPSDGTFYLFPRITDMLANNAKLTTDLDFAELLLNQANVALVPGSAFGLPGHIRITFAGELKALEEALKRIESVVS